MINYSIWDFEKFDTLEEFLSTINDNKKENIISSKAYGCIPLKNEFCILEKFADPSIKTIDLLNEKTRYLSFSANVQGCRKNFETDEYEARDIIEKVVAFEKNNKIKIIILASQNNAERIIKKIFKNELVWGLKQADDYINEDMLYWLFYRLREMPSEFIVSSPKMFLNGIISYLGRTNDKINAVRGIGTRVSALLGTLGMLLGEESLRALRPVIQFGGHEINVELFIGNTGKLYEKTYQGDLIIEDNDERSEVTLVLLVCKYILPNILKGYKDSCDSELWSVYIKQTFLRTVGNEMEEKISKEMKRISQEIQKLKDETEDFVDENSDVSEMEELLDEEELEELID